MDEGRLLGSRDAGGAVLANPSPSEGHCRMPPAYFSMPELAKAQLWTMREPPLVPVPACPPVPRVPSGRSGGV